MPWRTIYSVIDHVETIASLPLVAVGFWLARRQLIRTRKAAEAAKIAAERAKAEASRAGILALIPQLRQIEEEIGRAVRSGSPELVLTWSASWRWQAGQLRGHLEVVEHGNDTLLTALQESVASASIAQASLMRATGGVDLQRATRRLVESIAKVTNELGATLVHYSSRQEGEEAQ